MRNHKFARHFLVTASVLVTVAVLPCATRTAMAGTEKAGADPRSGLLDKALSRGGLRDAKVSALVVRHSDGSILYERSPDRLMIPASNAKVLTALAVLDAFGPAHQFETQLLSDTPPDHGGEVGSLYLRGGGDPAITTEDWWRLAAELRDTGLRRVRGDLVIDDTIFDRVRWHPTVEGISSRAYHAPVGALNANYGSFAVTVRPGAKVGARTLVTVNPPVPYLRISNEGRTLAAKERRSLVVDRSAGERVEVVEVRGGVRIGDAPKTYYRSVLFPDRYAGAVLKMQLAAVGVEVVGTTRSGKAPGGAHPLHTFEGRPLAEIVRLFMKFSNNGIAEALLKNLGALATGTRGTWESGVSEMRRRLVAHGVAAESFALVDGSGLSYRDRVAPRALVTALRVGLDSFRWGPEFMSSLPIAARDGTLEERAEGARDWVRAKTGLLNGVTGLSGYAAMTRGKDGKGEAQRELVIFSVLVNDYQQGDGAAMDALDDFVTLLTEAP